jgi:antitoxin component of MazEF toxin-antitoxin module
MIRTISKIGKSQGILFDAALLELIHLKRGDEVNVEVHEGGTITLTPIRPRRSGGEVSRVIKSTMEEYRRTMKRLARKV